ncbi:hypothetical protein ACFOMH_09295 [Paracoccus mangrovi]|uniref:Apolipoprotein acyltransferase n=1 Tax=Paracoccus mangrovi TaxID=1715645 RepID=A0ABV7R6I1_9RHOB
MACTMIVIAAFILGAAIGWIRATRLDGNRADKLQYAAAYGLALSVLGVFATVMIGRMG